MSGVTTPNLTPSNFADSFVGNWQGSTRLIPFDRIVALLLARIGPVHETRAQLFADLDWAVGAVGQVYGDSNSAFNGIYRKNGIFGGGSWTRIGDLPSGAIETDLIDAVASDLSELASVVGNKADLTALNTLASIVDDKASITALNAFGIIPLTNIGGADNAITATSPVTPAAGRRYLLTPISDNTGVTTLSINGAAPLTIRDSENAAISGGDLRAGVPITLLQTGSAGVRILGPSLATLAGAGGTLSDGEDFNNLTAPRTYYGLASHTYVRGPAAISGQACHVRVSIPGAGTDSARVRVLQEVFPVGDPSMVYIRYFNASSPRSCLGSGGNLKAA